MEATSLPEDEPAMTQSSDGPKKSDTKVDGMKFLVDLFHKCVQENPVKRPTAKEIYEMLLDEISHLKVQDVGKS